MTDYPNKSAGWRRRQVADRWRNIVSVFITLVLLLAVFNGFLKVSFSDYFGRSTIIGGIVVAAVNSSPGSLLIFQDDPKRLVLARFDDNLYFATGDPQRPTKRMLDIFNLEDGHRMRNAVSATVKIPVGHYLNVSDKEVFSTEDGFFKFFKNMASVATPLLILTRGELPGVEQTNLTRSDMISLWWQAKSLSINELVFVDTSEITTEIGLPGDEKVLGIDSLGVARELTSFVEDREILVQQSLVSVKNASGVAGAGQLAADLMLPLGVKVVRVEGADTQQEKSQILVAGGESYTARYLAKILECDIKTQPTVSDAEIIVVVGADFARRYQI